MNKIRNTKKIKKGKYDHRSVEKKWQEKWAEEKLYSPNMKESENKFYNLWMFPYPSGEGLHAGHAFASTGSDIYGRYMRMNEKKVFQPIGYDSFGMHSENYAIKIGVHPKDLLDKTTKNYERQMKELGHGYDWTKTVTTSDINYYKWTQWLFAQLFKAGLAYRKKAEVNWCPSCKTVLADEQVMTPSQAGKEPKGLKMGQVKDNAQICERCAYVVEKKTLSQWFLRITDYADRLLDNLDKIDWSERIKVAQRNWIGKSQGVELEFKIQDSDLTIKSFTTRPDTLHGATFFVLSPEHPQIKDVTISKYKKTVQVYVDKSKQKTKEDRIIGKGEKTGVFTGVYVINPANNKKIPVYVSDYVLMDYGTGAVMGVPAHDQRDWDFAKKEGLEIIKVVSGSGVDEQAHDGAGKLINSGEWNDFEIPREMERVISSIVKEGWGKKTEIYHLRDWLISRQRYWGPPIPMIYCQGCAKSGKSYYSDIKDNGLLHKDQSDWDSAGWWPEEKLPVELPFLKNYKPKGNERGPLADHPEFYKVKCPVCGKIAKRETDVSDTFLDSSWYFLRYSSVNIKNSKHKAPNKKVEIDNLELELPWLPSVTRAWLPVDLYFGGAEHAVLHLMYSRFITMALGDLNYIDFEEPFTKFYAHGLMIKDGAKMSKSRGNTVNPDEYIGKYGADTLRLYLMFMGPMDGYPDFRDEGIEGMRRFVDRVWDLCSRNLSEEENLDKINTKIHQTIKKVTEDVQKFRYNTAISAIMELINVMRNVKKNSKKSVGILVQLLAPFAPHLTEEIWRGILGNKSSIHTSNWPKYDSKHIKTDTVMIAVQINGKLRATITVDRLQSTDKEKVIELARKDEKVQKWLENKNTIKEIFVPGKLVNFVIGS